jgi:8-oxo-dGTP diphosphatase
MSNPSAPSLHVVAGVVGNALGEILIARRAFQTHQGGLWEFPGGKRENGETPYQALQRELREELDLEVQAARPMIRVHHVYPGKRAILLDVWRVEAWQGTPWGREGQPVRWCNPRELGEYEFPAANLPILRAAQLPSRYLITPEAEDQENFLAKLRASLENGIRLVQLRCKSLNREAYFSLAEAALDLCRRYGAQLLLNGDPAWVEELGAHGVHLDSARLMALSERPLPPAYRVTASCHNPQQIIHAGRLGLDCILLSPVRPTASHPEARALGWQRFFAWSELSRCPVYALGGMEIRHLPLAWAHGAQGIAGIRGLWGERAPGKRPGC